MLGTERRDKAPNAMIMPRFPSEIPWTKPVDMAKPENRPSILYLYYSTYQISQSHQLKRREEEKHRGVTREAFTVWPWRNAGSSERLF